ncbi:VanW family protein [Paenibacillus nasutitermitis]|uniref:G5 domain-containing protein n=1 Tax=Paenibacillus nasutitermitis TaxID=1652958 RepID=A0A917E1E5_9BACL|nr:VanW family protein [Paenibacillus nasutitermitis]GGD92061.1 hypothetical protein GCM10010911_58380 [Paenibacillus nasutitermitis]
MKKLHLTLIIAAALVLAGSAGWGFLWMYASRDSVPEGVTLIAHDPETTKASDGKLILRNTADLHLGGLSIEEALLELDSRKDDVLKLPLRIQANESEMQQRVWTLEELGVVVYLEEAKQAIQQLRLGSVWERTRYRWHFPKELTGQLRWDKDIFMSKIRGQWGWLDANEPADAERMITDDDKVVYTPHSNAYRLDTGKLFGQSMQAVEELLNRQWADGLKNSGDQDPKNNEEVSRTAITLPLALREISANVTLARLQSEGIERKIMSFTTDFSSSSAGRAYNVTMTAKTLNNWDLAPGEIFDYNKVIALTREHYGYREAPVILNGELVPGIGGGICQVSSTLYNAALLAGLDMVERRNHSLPVSYLPKGQDATFAEGAINFRFKNTTGKHVIIRTVVSGGKLTIKLFGTMPGNINYTIDSKTVKVIDPPVKEITSKTVPSGGRLLLSSGKSGYIVETYRTKTKDGKTVSRERVSRDTYRAQPTVYGVAEGNPNDGEIGKGKQLLEDGVAE